MGEGTVFSLSVHTSTGGGGGVPHPRSGQGGTPSQVCMGGGTSSKIRMGCTHPADWGEGIPSKIRMEGGYPGVTPPPLKLDGVPTPHPPPFRTGSGTPCQETDIRIASTCYTAGDVPLVFTQEDFLV